MMAGKAKLMANVIEKSLINDDEHNNRLAKMQMLLVSANAYTISTQTLPIFMHKPLPTECLLLAITIQLA
jgi:hypothetical protein